MYPALSRPALSLCAVALTGSALITAVPVAHAETGEPRLPESMSAIGGALLGRQGTQVDPGDGAPSLPRTTARSWIVADADSGDVLAAHNAHWQLAPASTLKMLFADTVLPKFSRSEEHVVEAADLDGMGDGSSQVGIKTGLPYTVEDLWRGVFLRSGNDAVHVLAAMNGGVARTVTEMQEKAEDLQADDTHVVTPDGYDMPGQVSSAYDLTLFARAGLQNADFRAYCGTANARFPGDAKKGSTDRDSFAIQNTNRLLTGDYGMRPYPGLAGVKNGYTSHAGNTFTGYAERGDRKLLVTVMHPGPGADEVYKEAGELLDWGFDASGRVAPVGTLVTPHSAHQVAAPEGAARGAAGGGTPAAASATNSGAAGMWTAAGITAGALAVLAAAGLVVRRRRPPAAGGRRRRTAAAEAAAEAATEAATDGE
jgi:D-alanyl-D-alanine carboxypeptidase (penicillin-binding protein 5/6)